VHAEVFSSSAESVSANKEPEAFTKEQLKLHLAHSNRELILDLQTLNALDNGEAVPVLEFNGKV